MKVLLLLLLYGTQQGQSQQGQSQQGQSQLVEVKVDEGGESVSLPCTASMATISSVIWKRVDLSPSTVHIRREVSPGDLQDDLKNQNQRFKDRTSLNPDLLTTRDVSLSLRNIQLDDRGNYTCTVTGGGKTDPSYVLLLVRSKEEIQLEKKNRDTAVGLGVGLTLVLALVGFLLFFAHRCGYLLFTKPSTGTGEERQLLTEKPSTIPLVEVEEKREGSVKLPCKITDHLPEGFRVVWSRYGSKPMMVHVNQDGTDQPDKQHQVYKGRTEMKGDLRTEDFSLTLREPKTADSGLYIWRVYNRGEELSYETAVELRVKGRGGEERQPLTSSTFPLVEVEEGVESVKLPCETSLHGLKDIVEWSYCDPDPVIVYVNDLNHPNKDSADKQNQVYRDRTWIKGEQGTGDLTLTLKKLKTTDSGLYICRVYKEGGELLYERAVALWVKG